MTPDIDAAEVTVAVPPSDSTESNQFTWYHQFLAVSRHDPLPGNDDVSGTAIPSSIRGPGTDTSTASIENHSGSTGGNRLNREVWQSKLKVGLLVVLSVAAGAGVGLFLYYFRIDADRGSHTNAEIQRNQ